MISITRWPYAWQGLQFIGTGKLLPQRQTGATWSNSRVSFAINSHHNSLALIAAVVFVTSSTWAQNVLVPQPLSTTQVLNAMQRHDQQQAKELQQYQALRHYSIVYRGFMRTVTASMDVEVDYHADSGKNFRIVSQTGSITLCQKVLKRALDSEREASLNSSETALTPANYRFEFDGTDQLSGRLAYVFNVEPITPSKFLYRGKIWIDGTDFAVAKMEVQPARNPSIWLSRTIIHHTNKLTNGFWLPEKNRSETKVRIGGTAVMTIDYGSYRIASRPEPTGSTPLHINQRSLGFLNAPLAQKRPTSELTLY